ncbi:hypothetical protein LQZ18_16025 [Lachnospiraceae bacterium ZAX-1]
MSHTLYRICLLSVALIVIIGGIFYYLNYVQREDSPIVEGTLVRTEKAREEDAKKAAIREEDARKAATKKEDTRQVATREEDARKVATKKEDAKQVAARKDTREIIRL